MSPSEISIIPAACQVKHWSFHLAPSVPEPQALPRLRSELKGGMRGSREHQEGGLSAACQSSKQFPPPRFPNPARLARWKAGNIRVWTVVQTGPRSPSSLSCLTNLDTWQMPFPLTGVAHLEVGPAHCLQADVHTAPFLSDCSLCVHWSLRRPSCSDGVAGSR